VLKVFIEAQDLFIYLFPYNKFPVSVLNLKIGLDDIQYGQVNNRFTVMEALTLQIIIRSWFQSVSKLRDQSSFSHSGFTNNRHHLTRSSLNLLIRFHECCHRVWTAYKPGQSLGDRCIKPGFHLTGCNQFIGFLRFFFAFNLQFAQIVKLKIMLDNFLGVF